MSVCCQGRDRESRAVYHEPDGERHLSEDLRGIRGHRRHPATPQTGVEPGLIHWVDSHTHIICQILPEEGKIHVNVVIKGPSPFHFVSPLSLLHHKCTHCGTQDKIIFMHVVDEGNVCVKR